MSNKIAFIGLGVMGSPMASNLSKGYSVQGWNRSKRPSVQEAVQAGVEVVPTISEAVKEADLICICVGDVEDVKKVIFGEGGIAAHAKNNSLIIDFSTIGPIAAREIAANLKPHNLRFIDAPVSGGDVGAKNGTLTIMVGGEKDAFQESLPLLERMGKKIVHCGEVGKGQAVKLCNQVICAINLVAVCEGIKLAEKLELDPNLMIEVCSGGAADSWQSRNLGVKINESDLNPGFMIKHILKDLRLVKESIADTNIDLPGIKLADSLFKIVENMGGSEQGTQAMIRAYRES